MLSAMVGRIGSGGARRAAERALRGMPQAAIARRGGIIARVIAKQFAVRAPATRNPTL